VKNNGKAAQWSAQGIEALKYFLLRRTVFVTSYQE